MRMNVLLIWPRRVTYKRFGGGRGFVFMPACVGKSVWPATTLSFCWAWGRKTESEIFSVHPCANLANLTINTSVEKDISSSKVILISSLDYEEAQPVSRLIISTSPKEPSVPILLQRQLRTCFRSLDWMIVIWAGHISRIKTSLFAGGST